MYAGGPSKHFLQFDFDVRKSGKLIITSGKIERLIKLTNLNLFSSLLINSQFVYFKDRYFDILYIF